MSTGNNFLRSLPPTGSNKQTGSNTGESDEQEGSALFSSIDGVRNNFNKERDLLEKRSDLYPQAKAERIQKLKLEADEKIEGFKSQYYESKQSEANEINSNLFGIGHRTDATASDREAKQANYRSAIQAASNLMIDGKTGQTKRNFEDAISKAKRSGDDLMLKAVSLAAHEAGYHSIAESAFEGENKARYRRYLRMTSNNRDDRLAESIMFRKVS